MTQNEKLIRDYVEAWNDGNEGALREYVAEGHIHNDPVNPQIGRGPNGEIDKMRKYRAAYPDLEFRIVSLLEQGDQVATHWTATGTQMGELEGIPATAKPVEVAGMSFYRIAEGQIVESTILWDAYGMLQQLGVLAHAAGRQ